MTDISLLKSSEAKLEYLAHHDPLTGLPNRLLLQSRLEHALDRAERHHLSVAVLYIDLDRFKDINDSLGHPVGDQLLDALARRMAQRLREEDTLGRLGGDEFLLIMEDLERPEDAASVAQSLIQLLEEPFKLQQRPRGLHRRQHRHQPCFRKTALGHRADPACRRGHVPGQGIRPRCLAVSIPNR
jgi:diguanylate cyclase (GGDEF)-like protein